MADVFVSYKRKLRSRVQGLVEELRRLRLDVWFDAELKAGSDYNAAINGELRSAKAVIVCWTPAVFESAAPGDVRWVVGEAQSALGERKLVPTFFEPTTLDVPWNTLHTENLIDWTPAARSSEGWLGMLRQVGALVGRPGLAAYAEADARNDPKALKAFATTYRDDPLAAGLRERVLDLEAEAARAKAKADWEEEEKKRAAEKLRAEQAAEEARRKPGLTDGTATDGSTTTGGSTTTSGSTTTGGGTTTGGDTTVRIEKRGVNPVIRVLLYGAAVAIFIAGALFGAGAPLWVQALGAVAEIGIVLTIVLSGAMF